MCIWCRERSGARQCEYDDKDKQINETKGYHPDNMTRSYASWEYKQACGVCVIFRCCLSVFSVPPWWMIGENYSPQSHRENRGDTEKMGSRLLTLGTAFSVELFQSCKCLSDWSLCLWGTPDQSGKLNAKTSWRETEWHVIPTRSQAFPQSNLPAPQ